MYCCVSGLVQSAMSSLSRIQNCQNTEGELCTPQMELYSPSTAGWLDAFDTWLLCKDTIYQTCNPCHCKETSCRPVSFVIQGRQLQFDTWLEQIPSSQHRVISAPLWPTPEKPQACPHLAEGIDAESANTGIHLVWRTVRPYTATHHWRQSSIGTPLKKTAVTWISLQAVVCVFNSGVGV